MDSKQKKALYESRELDRRNPVAGEDVPGNYYEWPHVGWWKSKEEIARKMSPTQLHYARLDCDKAARANPKGDQESKYRDEGSIYAQEMGRRGPQAEAIAARSTLVEGSYSGKPTVEPKVGMKVGATDGPGQFPGDGGTGIIVGKQDSEWGPSWIVKMDDGRREFISGNELKTDHNAHQGIGWYSMDDVAKSKAAYLKSKGYKGESATDKESYTLESPRLHFNWGFHDAASDVKSKRPKRQVGKGNPPSKPGPYPLNPADPAYAAGYMAGWDTASAGKPTDSSDAAWQGWKGKNETTLRGRDINSLDMNLVMSDIGARLDQGPATFDELLKTMEKGYQNSPEALRHILDVLVKGAKLKLSGGKYAKNESKLSEGDIIQFPGTKKPEEHKWPSKEDLKKRYNLLGKVMKIKGGRRRYVVVHAHVFGHNLEYARYTLTALSGSDKGSQPSNDGPDNIGQHFEIDSDQTIVFSGVEKLRRERDYLHGVGRPEEYPPSHPEAPGATLVAAKASYTVAEGKESGSCSNCGDHLTPGTKNCDSCGEKAPMAVSEDAVKESADKLINRLLLKENRIDLNEGPMYMIGAKGLEPMGDEKVNILPKREYWLGDSSSPDHIVVTAVDNKWITFMRFPYHITQRIQYEIGKSMIDHGSRTHLASYSKYMSPIDKSSLEDLLRGGKGREVDPGDFKRIEVKVKFIGTKADDPRGDSSGWYAAEEYGGVGGETLPDKSEILSIHTSVSGFKQIQKDKRFKVVGNQTESTLKEYLSGADFKIGDRVKLDPDWASRNTGGHSWVAFVHGKIVGLPTEFGNVLEVDWDTAALSPLEKAKFRDAIGSEVVLGAVVKESKEKFQIYVNGRYRYFDSLEAAKKVADEIFDKTGNIVGIEAVSEAQKESKSGYNPGGPIGYMAPHMDTSGPKVDWVLVHVGGKLDGQPAKESSPWKAKMSEKEGANENLEFHRKGIRLVWKPVIDPRTGKKFEYESIALSPAKKEATEGETLTKDNVRVGLRIVSKDNPDWGTKIVRKDRNGWYWEHEDGRGAAMLDTAEFKFWKLAEALKAHGDNVPYTIKFSVGGREQSWTRYNSKGMEAALADAKDAIAKEFPGKEVRQLRIEPASVGEAKVTEGSTRTFTYRVEYTTASPTVHQTPAGWKPKVAEGGGKPTAANLARHVEHLNKSFEPGGVNAHVADRFGFAAKIVAARIVRQADNEIMATWVMSKTESKITEEAAAQFAVYFYDQAADPSMTTFGHLICTEFAGTLAHAKVLADKYAEKGATGASVRDTKDAWKRQYAAGSVHESKEPIMEPGFVKTPADEEKWQKAKTAAKKSSPDNMYALANSIFHKMKGEASVAEAKLNEFKCTTCGGDTLRVPTQEYPKVQCVNCLNQGAFKKAGFKEPPQPPSPSKKTEKAEESWKVTFKMPGRPASMGTDTSEKTVGSRAEAQKAVDEFKQRWKDRPESTATIYQWVDGKWVADGKNESKISEAQDAAAAWAKSELSQKYPDSIRFKDAFMKGWNSGDPKKIPQPYRASAPDLNAFALGARSRQASSGE